MSTQTDLYTENNHRFTMIDYFKPNRTSGRRPICIRV